MVLVVESTPTNEDVSALSGRVITFPEGLIGCASWRHFRVESDGPDDAVLLLRCLDEPGVQLWAIDPFAIVPDYEVSIDEDSAQKIDLKDLSDGLVLCILTVRPPPIGVTANLAGPLIVNARQRLGLQLALADSPYPVRHPIHPVQDQESV